MNSQKFNLGRLLITANAASSLDAGSVADAVRRHASGDWGDLDAHDVRENERSTRNGWRVLSSYPVGEGRVWVITEADRAVTTILLPDEN